MHGAAARPGAAVAVLQTRPGAGHRGRDPRCAPDARTRGYGLMRPGPVRPHRTKCSGSLEDAPRGAARVTCTRGARASPIGHVWLQEVVEDVPAPPLSATRWPARLSFTMRAGVSATMTKTSLVSTRSCRKRVLSTFQTSLFVRSQPEAVLWIGMTTLRWALNDADFASALRVEPCRCAWRAFCSSTLSGRAYE